MNNLAPENVRW